MNCYRCLVEMECNHQPAVALCQRCGAAICGRHLVELKRTPLVGMAGGGLPSQSLICQHCYQLAFGPSLPSQPQKCSPTLKGPAQKASGFWQIWHRLRGRQQLELLNPEAVVAEAEFYLKQQRD